MYVVLGLILYRKLTLRQRYLQIRLKHQVLMNVVIQLCGEEMYTIAAAAFAFMHGNIGTAHESTCIGCICWIQADPGAATQVQFIPSHGETFTQHPEYVLRYHLRMFSIKQIIQQNKEVITAKARNSIAHPNTIAQAFCNLAQNQVSDIVSKGIVHLFKIIQIKADNRELMCSLGGSGYCSVEALREKRATGEIGQAVIVNELVHPFFLLIEAIL